MLMVTLSGAKGLKPCQQSRGLAALSMTNSHRCRGVGISPQPRAQWVSAGLSPATPLGDGSAGHPLWSLSCSWHGAQG